ncbi:glycosyltransferase family 4 protein [Leucobacter tenebrionis]|uniref:glycosyltransferase family 4 protein n=1 Tax=Leucobacter tenebrionis TaxID=2873270 RepID=UPI0021020DD4|nr:glycosyltransferase family 4 protein [Leucobacter tenebrionis]
MAGARGTWDARGADRRIGFARWRSDVASGGNRYDDEVSAALRTLGFDLREYPVTGEWPVPGPGHRREFASLLRAERCWLIENIVGSAAPEAIAEATRAGRKVVMLMHYFPSDDSALPARERTALAASEAEAVRTASTVVATSAWTAREIAARYGRTDALVAVPGVTRADPARGSERDGGAPALLWLGRLTETKDPLTLVDALAGVGDLPWSARLVGPDTVDPELRRELLRRIERAGLGGRIEITGPRTGAELEAIWARTDLLVHTARAEAYGMVVSEALARGIPSIVPLGTGAVEAQQSAGAQFAPGDVEQLTGRLRGWLGDPELREHWRARAAELRPRLPTWEAAAGAIAEAFTEKGSSPAE